MRPLVKKIGNHAVTLVKNGGNYIISDPTSIAFAEINDVMKAKFVGINQEMGLNPGIGMALNEGDKHERVTGNTRQEKNVPGQLQIQR